MVDDAELDLFNRHGMIVDTEDASGFARRRANPSREFRKVVGLVQKLDGLSPSISINQIIPIRDNVSQGTSRVAEGDATVHATSPLRLHQLVAWIMVDLKPVLHALFDGASRHHLTFDF